MCDKMKKIIHITLNLLLCITIALFTSIYIVKNNSFKLVQNSNTYEDAEQFFYNEKNKDITKIKEDIDEVNNPKPPIPVVPDYNISPKDFFQQNRILMIGDSFVEGMEAYGALYSSNTIWQRGKRIDDMSDQLEKAITYNPSALILSYGSNDVQMWSSNVDGFIAAYSNSLDNIANALPNTTVYVCSILPVSQEAINNDPSFQYISLFNERLQQLCNDRGIKFIDSSYILATVDDPYSPDGIHPKGFFYEKWANDILEKMR